MRLGLAARPAPLLAGPLLSYTVAESAARRAVSLVVGLHLAKVQAWVQIPYRALKSPAAALGLRPARRVGFSVQPFGFPVFVDDAAGLLS